MTTVKSTKKKKSPQPESPLRSLAVRQRAKDGVFVANGRTKDGFSIRYEGVTKEGAKAGVRERAELLMAYKAHQREILNARRRVGNKAKKSP